MQRLRLCLVFVLLAAAGARATTLSMIWKDFRQCTLLKTFLASNWAGSFNVSLTCEAADDWFSTAVTSGALVSSTPDIIMYDTQWIGYLVKHNVLLDITSWISQGNRSASNFYGITTGGMFDDVSAGKVYGIPIHGDIPYLCYRTDLFKKQGFSVPTTWAELLTLANQSVFSPLSGIVIPMCSSQSTCTNEFASMFAQLLWDNGGDMWNPSTYKVKGYLNSDTAKVSLEFMKKLMKMSLSSVSLEMDYNTALQKICQSAAAMAISNIQYWTISSSCPMLDNIAYTPIPFEKTLVLSTSGIGINRRSSSKTEALEFLDWFTSSSTQLAWVRQKNTTFTMRKDVLLDRREYLTDLVHTFARFLPYTNVYWSIPQYFDLLDNMKGTVRNALSSSSTVSDALDQAAKEQQSIIDDGYPCGRDGCSHTKEIIIGVVVGGGGLIIVSVIGAVIVGQYCRKRGRRDPKQLNVPMPMADDHTAQNFEPVPDLGNGFIHLTQTAGSVVPQSNQPPSSSMMPPPVAVTGVGSMAPTSGGPVSPVGMNSSSSGPGVPSGRQPPSQPAPQLPQAAYTRVETYYDAMGNPITTGQIALDAMGNPIGPPMGAPIGPI